MNKVAVVTGGSNGLGRCICKSLSARGMKVYNLDVANSPVDIDENLGSIIHLKCDVRDFNEVDLTKDTILEASGQVDIVINNASINYIAYIQDLDNDKVNNVIRTNINGYYNVAKVFVDSLAESKGTLVNVVSNAATMPMTASLVYNASKGAQLIMSKQLARELTKKYGITVFSISPNRLENTCMSDYIDEAGPEVRGWTKEFAREYQLKALLCGEETKPVVVSELLGYLLENKERHKYLSGCDLQLGL